MTDKKSFIFKGVQHLTIGTNIVIETTDFYIPTGHVEVPVCKIL